ncbi:MAG: histidine phosphatase family protein [Chloroflexota bacterium]|nr:histidine phosphatase family protein [Chloroflexota bacterium]
MTTNLYLIRHGESVPNVEPIIGGMRGDAGLTARGREQAALLEARLRAEGLRADRLYASTLPRARETAEYVARALGLPAVPDDELHELRPGEADGLTVDEWRARYGGFDGPMAEIDPFRPFAPGGESWATFLSRAGAALARLVARHPGETIVAVCHGGVLEASFYLACGLGPTGNPVFFAPLNTSITHWRHRPAGGRGAWTLVTFNDAAHLRVAGVPAASPEAVPTPVEEAGKAE